MYRNLGRKLKIIARVCFWVLLVGGVGFGLWALIWGPHGLEIPAALGMAAMPLVAWLLSLGLYTLGQMVENSDIRTDLLLRLNQTQGGAYAVQLPGQTAAQPQPRPQQPVYGQPAPDTAQDYYYAQPGADPYYGG